MTVFLPLFVTLFWTDKSTKHWRNCALLRLLRRQVVDKTTRSRFTSSRLLNYPRFGSPIDVVASLETDFFWLYLFHFNFSPQLFRVRKCEPRVQVATPLFSLLSLERSSLAVFTGVQDVVHPVFHVSIKWEAALLVYRFVIKQRLES